MLNFQNIDWKKIALIAVFIIIVIGVAYLLYALFFKAPILPTEPDEPGQVTQLPGADKGVQPGKVPGEEAGEGADLPTERVTKITTEQGFRPDTIAQGGITRVNDLDYNTNTEIVLDGNDLLSYQPDEGKFYRITQSGDKELLTKRIYKDVEDVAWAPDNDEAILEFPDGSNILYNFKTDRQISLPKDWTEFKFNKTGNSIGFKDMNENPDYRWLAMANPDGSGAKYLEFMGDKANRFEVDWSPSGSMVAQFNKGSGSLTSSIFFVGQHGENFRKINMNGYGVETEWTPDGSRIVYSAHNFNSEHKPLLHVVNASGETIGYDHQSLKLNTWPDKCAFADKDTMYCGVPKELPYAADYAPEIADDIPDYIYKVNLKTGVKSFVAEPEYSYTIETMQVSEDGEVLYFTDKLTKSLHTINLK